MTNNACNDNSIFKTSKNVFTNAINQVRNTNTNQKTNVAANFIHPNFNQDVNDILKNLYI